MIRSIIAVIAGWVVFGLSAAILFSLSGRDPHDAATPAFTIGSTLYGIVFAIAAGYIAARLAPARPLVHAVAVAIIIAAGATGSMLLQPGTAIWSQLAALVAMAPAAIAGGIVFTRRARTR